MPNQADLDELRRISGVSSVEPVNPRAAMISEDALELTDLVTRGEDTINAEREVAGDDVPAPKIKPPTPAEMQTDQLDQSIRHAATADAEGEASKRRMAVDLGIPKELLPDNAEEELFHKQNDAETLQRTHPATAKYMADQGNATIVGKDIEELKGMEMFMSRFVKDPLIDLLKGTIAVPETVAGLGGIARTAAPELVPVVLRNALKAIPQVAEAGDAVTRARRAVEGTVDFKRSQEILDAMQSPERQEAQRLLAETQGFFPSLGQALETPSVIGGAVVQSIPSLGVSGVFAQQLMKIFPKLAPLVAGAAGEGLTITGSSAESIRQETQDGELNAPQALAAVTAGVAGTGINILGGKIAQKMGATDIDTAIASGSLKKALDASGMPARLATRVMTGVAGEGLEELGQSGVEQIAQNVALGKPWDEGVEEAMAIGFLAGGTLGGAVNVATTRTKKSILNRAIDNAAAKEVKAMAGAQHAEQGKEILEGLGGAAAESKLRTRSPEAFKEFVRTMAEDGETSITEVFIAADKFNESLAQSGLTPEELTEKMPEVARNLQVATETSGDVRIPIEDYLTYFVGSEAETSILDNLRVTPDGLTFNESQEYFQKQEADLTEQARQIITENEPVLSREDYADHTMGQEAPAYEDYLKNHENKVEAFAADASEVHEQILQGLNKAGRFTKAVNASYAIPFREFFAVNAARQGVMPSELFKTMPLNFRNVTINGGSLTQKDAPPEAALLPPTLDVDGATRSTTNSEGQLLAKDEEGVRNFWRWFGDSKIVDAEGRPKVMYHGSPNDFEVFDFERMGEQGTSEGQGLYFTPNRAVAETYATGGKLFATYLRVRGPYSDKKRTVTKGQIKKVLKELHRNDPDALSNYGDVDFEGVNGVLTNAVEIEDNAESDADFVGSLINGGIATIEEVFASLTEATGRDGVVTEWLSPDKESSIEVVVVTNPTQIKSVENVGPFNPADPNIFKQSTFLSPESVTKFAEGLAAEVGLKTLQLSLNNQGNLKLGTIIVAKADRKKGVGTQAMERITEYADHHGLKTVLTPAVQDDFQGTTSRGRLVKFYKRFGFVENKGRNKDFEISEGMFREPVRETLAQFAGPTAATADQFNLGRAKELAATGMANEDIRELTGWFQGVDDKWRFEIDDSKAAISTKYAARGMDWGDIFFNTVDARESTLLGDVVDHPALFAAYPALAQMDVGLIPASDGASFDAGQGSKPPQIKIGAKVRKTNLLSVIMHEVQHGLQNIEGFARGGSTELIAQLKQDQIKDLTELTRNPEVLGIIQEVDKLRFKLEGQPVAKAEVEKQLAELEAELSKDSAVFKDYRDVVDTVSFLDSEQSLEQGYRRLAGEIEARNTQDRLGLNEGARRILSPQSTQDVPDDQAIVIFRKPQVDATKPLPVPDNLTPSTTLAQSTFFSALEREIGGLKKVANKEGFIKPKQAIAWITARQKEGKFKKEEVEAVGILDWLAAEEDPVHLTGIESFVQMNGVQIEDVELREGGLGALFGEGEDNEWFVVDAEGAVEEYFANLDDAEHYVAASDDVDLTIDSAYNPELDEGEPGTKFEQYTLPGGENYKELLLTLPGDFKFQDTAHFEQENILAHIRFNEREAEAPLSEEMLAEKAAYSAALPEILEIEQQQAKARRQTSQERKPIRDRLRDEVEAEGKLLRHEIESEVEDRLRTLPPTPGMLLQKELNDRRNELPQKPDFLNFAPKDRVLFIEEIQSDWAQAGRKRGFRVSKQREAEIRRRTKEIEALGVEAPSDLKTEWAALMTELQPERLGTKVSQGPFVKDTKAWTALAMKRMMRYAAENGFDRIAWTTGAQQVDRFDLSKRLSEVRYSGDTIKAHDHDGNLVISQSGVTDENLEDHIGKEAAAKLLAQPKEGQGQIRTLKGLDLKVGGEGMIAFYDKIVPQVANDILKKLKGPKVEVVEMGDKKLREARDDFPVDDRVGEQLGFEITPELREKILQGLPLFQGDRASYNPKTFTISLLEGSDLSSTIHEGGHFYLEALAEMAGKPNAPQQIVDDFNKAMSWFGIEDPNTWRSMTLEEKRMSHEQWAQSFERYILEGKAPTTKMQPVFARFRTWMLDVYKSMRDFLETNPLAGKLNDEIRQVFDRLLAAEDAILETEKEREYAPLFNTAEEAGVSPSKFQAYLDEGEAATAQSIDELSSRSLRDMRWLANAKSRVIKELQAEAKDKRAAIRTQVAVEVMSEPINQARGFLRKGEFFNADGSTTKVDEPFKLNTDNVKALQPDIDLGKIRGMTSPKGAHPDLAAQMFGFDSGDALITELAEGERPAERIENLTTQRMLEEHGDLVDNRAVEIAAEKAIHNEARARFMATGLQMLTKSSITVPQINRAAKAAAEAAIAQKKIRELTPGQYARAEAKANKESTKKAAKDPNGAIKAQRAALLNNRLVRAATEARTEVEKHLRYLRKFDKPSLRKSVDAEYLEQIQDLLSGFDLRKGVTAKAIDKRKSLADWMADQQALGYEPALDPALLDDLKRKHYKEMTMEELRGLVDGVKQVEHFGRMKHRMLTDKEARDFQALANDAEDSIRANANRVVKARGTPTDVIGITAQWARRMAAAHRKFNSFIREMDGSKDNGVMWNLFSRGMNEAGDNETQMKQDAANAIADLFKKLPKDGTVAGNIYARKKLVPGTDFSMTHEQRVMFAMNWGNEGNRQRLLDGGTTGKKALSPAQAQKVLDTLTKEDWEFVQGVWDYIGSFKPQVAALEKQLTGVAPEWVEATPITTKFGTFTGGYFPAKYDALLSTRSESLEAVTDLRMGMKAAFGASATRSGYVKNRADAVIGRPLLLSYNVISQHVSEVTHRLAWQPWLIDANRMLKALDQPIRDHYGVEVLQEMRDTIEDIATGDNPGRNAMEVAINRVRTGSTIVGLGWRFSTALMQFTGLSQSAVRIGSGWMGRGVVDYLKNPLAAGRLVDSKSKLMTDRGRTMMREINEVLNTVRSGEGLNNVTASYFTMIGKAQRMVDIPTWLGAYEKALHELKAENATDDKQRQDIDEKAAALADQAVVDSQSGGQVKDLARVQRGSPLWKLFTNFYSYFSAAYNMNIEAFRRTNFKSPSEVGAFAIDMLLLNTVPVVLGLAVKEGLKPSCEELDCYAEKLAKEQISHLMGQMILLREMSAGVEGALGMQTYGYQGPAGLRFFSDVQKAGVQLGQGEADAALYKALNNVGGAVLHYPAGQVAATVEGIAAIERGDVGPEGMLQAILAGSPK